MALIHLLERRQDGNQIAVRAACHVPIESGEDRARVAALKPVSVVPGLSQDEADDVVFGRVAEFVRTLRFEPGAGKSAIQAALEGVHQNIASQTAPQVLAELAEAADLEGATFDGKSWSK